MTDTIDAIKKLQKDVQYLLDRTAILDCINRHSRAQDRHDVELLTSVYHPDGIDEHGNVITKAQDYAKWVNALHDADFRLHTHNITTHNCEINGNEAHCDNYVLFGLITRDNKTVWFGGGRYIDRLEKLNGEWKISLRRVLIDYMFTADASVLNTKYYIDQGYPTGINSKEDISYQRPLRLDTNRFQGN